MSLPNRRKCLLLVASLALLALPACADNDRNFGFEFGMLDPNKDVEILNWRYGNSKLAYSHAPDAYLAMGHIPEADDVNGMFPPGDVLYVKWRVLSTGKVYEDTVDLHSSLPRDMKDKTIHFAIKGAQLYVYLVEGITSKQLHARGAPDCPPVVYKPFQCTRIYPDHWTNF